MALFRPDILPGDSNMHVTRIPGFTVALARLAEAGYQLNGFGYDVSRQLAANTLSCTVDGWNGDVPVSVRLQFNEGTGQMLGHNVLGA